MRRRIRRCLECGERSVSVSLIFSFVSIVSIRNITTQRVPDSPQSPSVICAGESREVEYGYSVEYDKNTNGKMPD